MFNRGLLKCHFTAGPDISDLVSEIESGISSRFISDMVILRGAQQFTMVDTLNYAIERISSTLSILIKYSTKPTDQAIFSLKMVSTLEKKSINDAYKFIQAIDCQVEEEVDIMHVFGRVGRDTLLKVRVQRRKDVLEEQPLSKLVIHNLESNCALRKLANGENFISNSPLIFDEDQPNVMISVKRSNHSN